jgi:CRISPR-associated protein Cas5d
MLDKEIVRIKVEGEFACFTRPDLKVERMTYPCMTPSAARGILDSILWKPEFNWYVRHIIVLNPVKFFSVKRNEINSKQGRNEIIIEDKRAQRNSIVLKDVAYIIEASVFQKDPSDKNPPKKYAEMFKRRVNKGQCYRRPFLGTREFAAEFSPPTEKDVPELTTIPIGSMLFDIFWDQNGKPSPVFFYDVAVENGVLDCEKNDEYKALNMKMMESSHLRPEHDSEVSAVLYDFKTMEDAI